MIILVWVIALLGLPAGAAAEDEAEKPFSAEFSVEGSNGYRISVYGRSNSVTVSVFEGRPRPGKRVVAEYTAAGTVSTEGIEATFGDLGEISVQFQPSGKVSRSKPKLPKHCSRPRRIVRQEGVFVGTIRFTGEANYTAFEGEEADGSIGTPDELFCVSFANGSHPLSPVLTVATTLHDLGFDAVLFPGRSQVRFEAARLEKDGRVSIRRSVSVEGPPSSFKFDRKLTTATVIPPPPFVGTATYRRKPGRGNFSWSGSLTVSFPGAPEVPLTSPSFTNASLENF
jgi:hypothetical protein